MNDHSLSLTTRESHRLETCRSVIACSTVLKSREGNRSRIETRSLDTLLATVPIRLDRDRVVLDPVPVDERDDGPSRDQDGLERRR